MVADHLATNTKRRFSAFTLTEVIIVVAIIAILATLAIWAYRTQIYKGFDSRRKTDMYQIKVALEEYEKDHNCYPTVALYTADPDALLKPYVPSVPKDPRTKEEYVYIPDSSTGCPKWYWLFTNLENPSDKDTQALGCLSGCGDGITNSYSYYVSSYNAPEPEKGNTSTSQPPGTTPTPDGHTYYGCFATECRQIPNQYYCEPNYKDAACPFGCVNDEGNPNPGSQCM